MKKCLFMTCILLIFTSINAFAADNIVFVSKGISTDTIKIINGSTGTWIKTDQLYDTILTYEIDGKILKDINGEYIIKSTDINGDFKDDIVCFYKNDSTYKAIALNGVEKNVIWNKNDFYGEIIWADIVCDSNGSNKEIAYLEYEWSVNKYYKFHIKSRSANNGNTTGKDLTPYPSYVSSLQYQLNSVHIDDFNGDSYKDVHLFMSNLSACKYTSWVYNVHANDTIWTDKNVTCYFCSKAFVTTGDYNNDGKKDIHIANDTAHYAMNFYTDPVDGYLWGNDSTGKKRIPGNYYSDQILETYTGYLSENDYADVLFVIKNSFDSNSCRLVTIEGQNGNTLYNVSLYSNHELYKIPINIGDFIAKNGYDDIIAITRNAQMNDYSIRSIKGSDGTISWNIQNQNFGLSADSSTGVLSETVGDFNGDGASDIFILGVNSAVSSNRNFIALNGNTGQTLWDTIVSGNSFTSKVIGPRTKYISNHDDKYFNKPLIKEFRNSSENIFPIGWYEGVVGSYGGPYNAGCDTNHPLSTRITDLKTYCSSDFTMPYMDTRYPIGGINDSSSLNSLVNYINNISSSNYYPKSTIPQLLYLVKEINDYHDLPSEGTLNDTNSQYVKSFKRLEIEPINRVLGWYVGDDFNRTTIVQNDSGVIRGTDTIYPGIFNRSRNLYNWIIQNSNRYTYAADGMSPDDWDTNRFFDNVFDQSFVPFDIPMVQLYPYSIAWNGSEKEDSMITVSTRMPNFPKILHRLRKGMSKHNNIISYMYITQAHACWSPFFPPSWSLTRYEIFNSIINGAGGLIYFMYPFSDKFGHSYPGRSYNVADNHKNITREITGGYSNQANKSLQDALSNGKVQNITIFSSKDGFDGDYNDHYDEPESFWHYYYGRLTSDINYILRYSDGTYYVIAINNSRHEVINTRFYLSNNINLTKLYYQYADSTGNFADYTVTSKGTVRKNGNLYKYFDVSSFKPFEVKIFRIGDAPGSGPGHEEQKSAVDQVVYTFALEKNYPNPFNPNTTVKYSLARNEKVTLEIYNVLGQKVKTLVNNKATEAGNYSVIWNGKNDHGSAVASGVYVYRLKAGNFVKSHKMILLK